MLANKFSHDILIKTYNNLHAVHSTPVKHQSRHVHSEHEQAVSFWLAGKQYPTLHP